MTDLEMIMNSVRHKADLQQIRITQHAQQEMTEETIRLDDILCVLSNGRIIENYPSHLRGCLLLNTRCRCIGTGYSRCPYDRPTCAYHYYIVFAFTAEVDFANSTENRPMKCSIQGCSGGYQPKTVLHTVRVDGRVLVIDHVPAEVCDICGDVLFTPQTVRRIEELLADLPKPAQTVPLFEYA